jgi:hypothetical protein
MRIGGCLFGLIGFLVGLITSTAVLEEGETVRNWVEGSVWVTIFTIAGVAFGIAIGTVFFDVQCWWQRRQREKRQRNSAQA